MGILFEYPAEIVHICIIEAYHIECLLRVFKSKRK